MIPSIRQAFNASFSKEKYQAFLDDLNSHHPGDIEFRVAETAIYVPKDFKNKMLEACEHIVDILVSPGFKENTAAAIPAGLTVPNEDAHTNFIAFDFGICVNEAGEYEPQLIEMQGFPSLFGYEVLLDDVFSKHFPPPPGFSSYLGGLDRESYSKVLKELILGSHDPAEVILLEIFPHQQKTRIDFYCTSEIAGIPVVCLTELTREGKKLFYEKDGKKLQVKRIYNRVIFDELFQQSEEVKKKGQLFFEDLEVEWCPHPNWFYRISKYTIPFIKHPFVPPTWFLHEVKELPADLQNYVLKPLFSFAGQGVVIDITPADIEKIKDPENWILQRKVKYADVIETPDIPAKVEIRIFYFWKNGDPRPFPANNLGRLSKGKMIGVRYNKDKEWVGGSFCYFEK